MIRQFHVLIIASCCIVISCRPSGSTVDDRVPTPGGVDQPLTSFQQNITSTTTKLNLQAGQDIKVPVRIENPGQERWASAGRFPVDVSYKWFTGATMLPIEGERTVLPMPITPKGALDLDVRVVAPNEPGDYALRITLVQEAVAWFMIKGNTYLELPVTVR